MKENGTEPDVLNRMAGYELLLRIADCKMRLLTVALNDEIEKLAREEAVPPDKKRKRGKKKSTWEIPERLKRKLIGEAVLAFDKTFPIYLARITQIDERLNRILTELIFLNEDLERLPDNIREAVTCEITGHNERLASRLKDLSSRGSSLLSEWLEVAMNIAGERLHYITDALKVFDRFER